jgi:hypothetical protein
MCGMNFHPLPTIPTTSIQKKDVTQAHLSGAAHWCACQSRAAAALLSASRCTGRAPAHNRIHTEALNEVAYVGCVAVTSPHQLTTVLAQL